MKILIDLKAPFVLTAIYQNVVVLIVCQCCQAWLRTAANHAGVRTDQLSLSIDTLQND